MSPDPGIHINNMEVSMFKEAGQFFSLFAGTGSLFFVQPAYAAVPVVDVVNLFQVGLLGVFLVVVVLLFLVMVVRGRGAKKNPLVQHASVGANEVTNNTGEVDVGGVGSPRR